MIIVFFLPLVSLSTQLSILASILVFRNESTRIELTVIAGISSHPAPPAAISQQEWNKLTFVSSSVYLLC